MVIRRYTIHPPQLEGRAWEEARQELQRFLRYLMDANDSGQTGSGIVGVVDGTIDHGEIDGLDDDDHEQYLKEKLHGGLAAEIPLHTHAEDAEGGTIVHSDLTDLGEDDHTQYLKEKIDGGLAAEIPLHTHADSSEAGTIIHGDLTDLGEDDHTQYILVDGTRAFTGNQSMGQHSLTAAESVQFDITPATEPAPAGSLYWDVADGTLSLRQLNSVTQQIGQESYIYALNKTGAPLLEGRCVKITGAQGQRVTIDYASSAVHQDVHSAVGVLTQTINHNDQGYVTVEGLVRNIDTSLWADGTPLYLSTAGQLTSTFPVKPGNLLHVAVVVNGGSGGAGSIFVKLGIAEQLEELTDVSITTPANLDPLVYDSTNLYWKNQRTFQRLHGFELSSAGAALQTITYDKTTKKITVTPTGATFRFWIDGTPFTKTGAQVAGTAHGTTTGKYFFYYDSAGVLQTSAVETPWSIRDRTVTPVALVYWNNTLSDGICFYECHTADRHLEQHYRDHFSQGTQYISGGDLTGYTPSTDTDAAVTYAIGSGFIADEDIRFEFGNVADGGPYVVFYRSGGSGEWTWDATPVFPFLRGATYPSWNNLNAGGVGVWGMTELVGTGGGNWVNYYVCATSAVTPAAASGFLIPGQTSHGSLASAQAESLTSLSLGTLPFEEVRGIWRVTIHARSTYGGTTQSEIVQVTKITSQSVTVTGAGITDHGALTGLADDDHTQYQLRTEKAAANGYASLDAGTLVPVAQLATGTPDGTKYLRDDRTWQAVTGGSGLTHPQVLARTMGA